MSFQKIKAKLLQICDDKKSNQKNLYEFNSNRMIGLATAEQIKKLN